MSSNRTEARRGRGRPPEGLNQAGEPERIRDYPRALFTMRPATRKRLKRAAHREGRPEWRIVDDALEAYFRRQK
jgi:hypothetical protein